MAAYILFELLRNFLTTAFTTTKNNKRQNKVSKIRFPTGFVLLFVHTERMPHLKVRAVESAKYKIFNSPYIASSYNHSTLLKFRGRKEKNIVSGKVIREECFACRG